MIEVIRKLFKYGWPTIIILTIIFYLSCLLPEDGIPDTKIPYADKIVHLLMYGGLSLVSSLYYIHKKEGEVIILRLIIFVIILPITYGGIIEILQGTYFNREGDWADFGANALGSLCSLPISLAYRRFLLKQKDL